MARAIWSGAISFGLVSIPVKLYTATRDHDVHFHQLHGKDNSRVKYQLVCAEEQREISRDDVVKGYQVGPDQYVVVKDDELDRLEPEKSRRLDISEFVDLAQIDPIYFDRPYYLLPDEQAARPYRLLVEAMTRSAKVAIARFVMRNKEYLAALRPLDGVLCLETMHFADEVVAPQSLEGVPEAKVNDKELKMAEQLIESLADKFEPQRYRDEYRDRLEELIRKKAEGVEIELPKPSKQPQPVLSLVSALEQSVANLKQKKKTQKRKKTA